MNLALNAARKSLPVRPPLGNLVQMTELQFLKGVLLTELIERMSVGIHDLFHVPYWGQVERAMTSRARPTTKPKLGYMPLQRGREATIQDHEYDPRCSNRCAKGDS